MRTWLTACALSAAASSCSLVDFARAAHGSSEAYALDDIDRYPNAHGGVTCHPELLQRYRGTWVKLLPPSDVAPEFALRIERFEEVLARIGQQAYGRAPIGILHVGTYACRETERRSARLSEHALGNAIDVSGFRFPALPRARADSIAPPLPTKLRGPFTVTVLNDYLPPKRATEVSERHQLFFSLLRRALLEHEIFRGVIGPPYPDHSGHLHLDMAPWVYSRL